MPALSFTEQLAQRLDRRRRMAEPYKLTPTVCLSGDEAQRVLDALQALALYAEIEGQFGKEARDALAALDANQEEET